MATAIRLKREGRKNRPYYRVIVTDRRNKRDGQFIEQIGTYDPVKKEDNFNLDLDRIDHWISCGAQPSETVASMIKKARKARAAA